MLFGHEFEETIPVYKFNDDGKVQNVRPSIYHRNAQADMQKYGTSNVIGYKVKNQFGNAKYMTFKQFHRMRDLFDQKALEIVDYWRTYDHAPEYALAGYDTECENAGFNRLY